MGSDQAGKNEIEAQVLAQADLYVADRVSQCVALGELRSGVEAALISQDGIPELGQIVAGDKPGRPSPDAITICDLTGTGAQDTAIATFAVTEARKRGLGTVIQA
jgi:ornithine cyclodeaminase